MIRVIVMELGRFMRAGPRILVSGGVTPLLHWFAMRAQGSLNE